MTNGGFPFLPRGGTLIHSYLGHPIPGGSNEAMVTLKFYCKRVVVPYPGLITSVSAYMSNDAGGDVSFMTSCLWTDKANGPAKLLSYSAPYVNQSLAPSTGALDFRWLHFPHGVWVDVAGPLWLGVVCIGSFPFSIGYDANGSDVTFTSGGNWIPDGTLYANTTTAKKYNIRASLVA